MQTNHRDTNSLPFILLFVDILMKVATVVEFFTYAHCFAKELVFVISFHASS